MPVKLCIAGVAGRMGQRLLALAQEDTELKVTYTLEHSRHAWIGQDAGLASNVGALGAPVACSICPNCAFDVLIDFTVADAAVAHATAAAAEGKALVIGTTGLTEAQKKQIAACAQKVPVLHAGNFSTGIHVLMKAAALVAKTLGPAYQIEIVEAHHDQKVDAPSGTALMLAEAVAGALDKDLQADAVYGRHGHTGRRTKKEIGIHALRMGDVVGDHTVYFAIGGERIELTHRASSRDTFARGALRAAKWLAGQQQPGFYTMAQVLEK